MLPFKINSALQLYCFRLSVILLSYDSRSTLLRPDRRKNLVEYYYICVKAWCFNLSLKEWCSACCSPLLSFPDHRTFFAFQMYVFIYRLFLSSWLIFFPSVQFFFLSSSHIGINLLSDDTKLTARWMQYNWTAPNRLLCCCWHNPSNFCPAIQLYCCRLSVDLLSYDNRFTQIRLDQRKNMDG